MLVRLYQIAIFIGVLFAFIYFDVRAEGYAGGAIALFTAYALSVWPIKLYDWLKYGKHYRAAKRALHARQKAAGYPYGWRRHMPWNANVRSWREDDFIAVEEPDSHFPVNLR